MQLLFFKQGLGTIKSISDSGIVDNASKQDYSDSQYNEILRLVEEMYGCMQYNFSQEAFWLIVGYAPPYNYIPVKNQKDLYACCFYKLHKMWFPYYQILKYQSPRHVLDAYCVLGHTVQNICAIYGTQLGIGEELHQDILKARKHLAEQWDDNIERDFIKHLPGEDLIEGHGHKGFYGHLFLQAKHIYEKISDEKTRYKSAKYAEDVFYANVLDECFTLAGIHLYQEVFETMSLISRTLWPLRCRS